MNRFVKAVGATAILFALCLTHPIAAQERPTLYLVSSTTGATISLPVGLERGPHLYRDASGKWAPLSVVREQKGIVTFTLGPAKALVLLGKPDWLAAEDDEPPKVTHMMVDGKEVTPSDDINLGWLDEPPQKLHLQVADDANPLDAGSVRVAVNGRVVKAGEPGVEFAHDPQDKRWGRIVCFLGPLGATDRDVVQFDVYCDDFAPDVAERRVSFTFTLTRLPQIALDKPAATTRGVKIYLDSIMSGYEAVECLLDGNLQAAGTTTFGSTWASAETNTPHWICLVFPKPRVISGVEISWAIYQDTFWTSERYSILTWDGKRWVSALKVNNNPPAQTSFHSFAPRTTDRVLVWTPAGGNHPRRPNLMWVTEVKVLP